jgi:hypothetical protein
MPVKENVPSQVNFLTDGASKGELCPPHPTAVNILTCHPGEVLVLMHRFYGGGWIGGLCREGEPERRSTVALEFERATELLG